MLVAASREARAEIRKPVRQQNKSNGACHSGKVALKVNKKLQL